MVKEQTTKIDPRYLYKETIPFDFEAEDAEKIHYMMSRLLVDKKALGCAATQIGINTSFFCFGDPSDLNTHVTVFNPKIVDYFGDDVYAEESCLSFPGLWIKIKRPESIRSRFTTWDGKTDTLTFGGMSSRVFQHEYDHLFGVTFQKRANIVHLDQGRRAQKKWLRINKKKKRSLDSSLSKHSASLD